MRERQLPSRKVSPYGSQTKEHMKTICITANDDRSFTVELEPAETAPESPEMGAENGMMDMAEDKQEGETGQTVASIDEAMNLARQMLQDDGRSPEEQMQAGYAKGRPGMNPAMVLGG